MQRQWKDGLSHRQNGLISEVHNINSKS